MPQERTPAVTATEADLVAFQDRRVAIIGYGSQGHAHALNLRDSGVDVIVGARPEGASARGARAAGFDVRAVAEAAAAADVVAVLIPDTAQPEVYAERIEPGLQEGDTLLFAHGFNVHYDEIRPPAGVDVVLVAPKSPGRMVREEFLAGRGTPALVAVEEDASGSARETAVAYAVGLGAHHAGILETTFADETETDLFGEQAVLCGGLSELVRAGFETLVDAGYSPELAYFECLHEMKLIVDLVYAGGLSAMREGVSDTAEYGDYVSGPRVIGEPVREAMREVLADVRSGKFARQWTAEARVGERFAVMRASARRHPLEQVGARLRRRMSWLQEDAGDAGDDTASDATAPGARQPSADAGITAATAQQDAGSADETAPAADGVRA